MYLMIDKKAPTVNWYLHFLFKRFLRIAPAFFASVLVYAVLIKINSAGFHFWYNVFFHFLFLNNVVSGVSISGPFWSIGVEWHFYMILPVLIAVGTRMSIVRAVILFSMASIAFFCIANLGYFDGLWWENQIVTRFPEFGCGIIAAYFFLEHKKIPKPFSGILGLVIGFIMMYLGRLMMFTPVLIATGKAAFIFKSISYTVMTTGFAFILYHVITIPSFLARILSTKVFAYLGKISYSIYLWHSLSFLILWNFLLKIGSGPFKVIPVFLAVTLLTIIIGHFSYRLLESFYFKKFTHIRRKLIASYAR